MKRRPTRSAGLGSCCDAFLIVGEYLAMTDAERFDPTLLAERQGNEEAKLDELGNRKVLVKFRP